MAAGNQVISCPVRKAQCKAPFVGFRRTAGCLNCSVHLDQRQSRGSINARAAAVNVHARRATQEFDPDLIFQIANLPT